MATAIEINTAVAYKKEVSVPRFDSKDDLDDFVPTRAGAIASVGEDMYHYSGTAWVLDSGGEGSASTFRGSISDL